MQEIVSWALLNALAWYGLYRLINLPEGREK